MVSAFPDTFSQGLLNGAALSGTSLMIQNGKQVAKSLSEGQDKVSRKFTFLGRKLLENFVRASPATSMKEEPSFSSRESGDIEHLLNTPRSDSASSSGALRTGENIEEATSSNSRKVLKVPRWALQRRSV